MFISNYAIFGIMLPTILSKSSFLRKVLLLLLFVSPMPSGVVVIQAQVRSSIPTRRLLKDMDS
jgi:hypothetical protein